MRVIGLDLSLTATGFALIEDDTITVRTITSKPHGDSLADRQARLHNLVADLLLAHLPIDPIDLVVIEQPAFSRTTGHHHDRSGLWWLVVDAIWGWREEITPMAEVSPTTLKKYATGKGNAAKDTVLLATARRFPHVDLRDNNMADALWLAAMGARHLGSPIDDMPKAHLAAMDAVRWPVI